MFRTPVISQSAIDNSAIVAGFAAKNAIGNDVVKLLQDAFNRKHLHVKCVALVNDVGVYMRDEVCAQRF